MAIKRLFFCFVFCLLGACVINAQEEALVQNAVLEGVQLSADTSSSKQGEMVVSCYFIFMDKPSSYFYEVRKRTKQLVFEFNDTKMGTSAINSIQQAPIEGFTVEKKTVDINKTVRGLKPEWHSQVVVTFSLSAIPILNITEQYGVVSFNYKWNSDPSKMASYMEKDNSKKVMYWTGGGVLAAGAGVAAYLVFGPKKQPEQTGPLPDNDLPNHPSLQ
ncbi:MAG: hypothetical protein PHC61_12325 [Chitinivibrionales bacterium]|nr:hypothetical protein [Chitinivibrionales bacterium]